MASILWDIALASLSSLGRIPCQCEFTKLSRVHSDAGDGVAAHPAHFSIPSLTIVDSCRDILSVSTIPNATGNVHLEYARKLGRLSRTPRVAGLCAPLRRSIRSSGLSDWDIALLYEVSLWILPDLDVLRVYAA